jgi:hypothetical protein
LTYVDGTGRRRRHPPAPRRAAQRLGHLAGFAGGGIQPIFFGGEEKTVFRIPEG